MLNATLTRLRGRLGLMAVLTTVVLGSTGATLSLATASASTHRSRHHRVVHHHSSIPQGRNAGDRDSDNHGGPSDGDGNL